MADESVKQIIKKLRNYEIKIRKAVNTRMHGDFHSIFKGSGLEFDDVRQYQYGDDIRTIHWNVTAKGYGTYIKTFKEEKEQTVYFMLDVSASQEIGRENFQKIDISKEVCGVLALTAIKEESQVGLICFSDVNEKYIKPDKGVQHGYDIISKIYKLKPKSLKTNINSAITFALNMIKKRSVIILISDFIDENYHKNIAALASKHDLVVIHVSERGEVKLPRLGIIPVLDKENNKLTWVNTSSFSFRKIINKQFVENTKNLELTCKKTNSSYIRIFTHEDISTKLIKLFQVRNQS